MGDGAVAAADVKARRVGGAGEKGDVGFAAAGNSRSHRGDVFGVGAGKQGRELEADIAGLVGVENVAVVAINLPSVLVVGACGGLVSDLGAGTAGSGGTAKNPESLVGVILAGIGVDDQLRLALFQRKERQQIGRCQSR